MDFPNWIIGVLLACVASFVSNLGLNLQKLNHLRNDRRAAAAASEPSSPPAASSHSNSAPSPDAASSNIRYFARHAPAPLHLNGRSSALTFPASASPSSSSSSSLSARAYPSYQSTDNLSHSNENRSLQPLPSPPSSTLLPPPLPTLSSPASSPAVPSSPTLDRSAPPSRTPSPPPSPLSYHRQTLWRVGLALVILGSLADFVALIFAAQSIIAPLGSLTLVFNTILAPFLLDEPVERVDVLATIAIVIGSSLSVACADHRDRLYRQDELFQLFIQPRFVLYSLLILAIIAALYYHIRYLSPPTPSTATSTSSYSKHTRFCYASLAGIVGAQSVLFAKCVGTLLVDTLTGHSVLFLHVWSWIIIALLTITITFQIHYLNEGLRLFTSSYIIPVYQSFWILVSVVNGLIFFGEYKGVYDEWSSGVGFPLGVLIVVAGVYVLSQRDGGEEEEEEEGGGGGMEESGGVEAVVEAGGLGGVMGGSAGGESVRERQWKERAVSFEDGKRRAKEIARLSRPTTQLPYQPLISASQSHHIAFPSVSSSAFFLPVPYRPRTLRRPVNRDRARTELQTAPIVSSPVMYMQLSSSSPETSYVPPLDIKEWRGDRTRAVDRVRFSDDESRARQQLYK